MDSFHNLVNLADYRDIERYKKYLNALENEMLVSEAEYVTEEVQNCSPFTNLHIKRSELLLKELNSRAKLIDILGEIKNTQAQ